MGCSFSRQRKKKLIAFSGDSVFIPHTAAAARLQQLNGINQRTSTVDYTFSISWFVLVKCYSSLHFFELFSIRHIRGVVHRMLKRIINEKKNYIVDTYKSIDQNSTTIYEYQLTVLQGAFNNYVDQKKQIGGQQKVNAFLRKQKEGTQQVCKMSTIVQWRGQEAKVGQNLVHVLLECPIQGHEKIWVLRLHICSQFVTIHNTVICV